MKKKTIRDIEMKDKRVLVRVDFNVPVADGKVTDDTRIEAALPTLKYILEQKPRSLILMSHLGRPKGERKPEFSLKPVVPVLQDHLGTEARFVDDCIGEKVEKAIEDLPQGGVILLENTRFHGGETKNNPEMSKQLAALGDVYVNDAFGSAHRAHASTTGVADHLPAVAGFLMEKELDFLVNAVESPERPFIAIMGGAKISDKIEVIQTLLQKVDRLLIGGGMANTFFKAQGTDVGESLVEDEVLDTARDLMEAAEGKIILPREVVIADAFDNNAKAMSIPSDENVPSGWRILDIGAGAIHAFQQELESARTIIWNGPMGVFEMPNFAKGTIQLAMTLAELTEKGTKTIIGGGDSAAAVQQAGVADKMTHISTGGGASLELLEGKQLPGVAALNDKA
ncbi:MAG: phosphoglycerate kinase [Chloroflexi bacterium]|nr:phosphoglycerate kinase [Chloroflexota bacterium]